ncbi:MAG: LPS assembly lipoprotein LptE [Pseudomonadota bacterium]
MASRHILAAMSASALFLLSGCGFQPLYAGPNTAALSAMEIEAGQSRIDYLIEDALAGAFGSTGGPSPYRLTLESQTRELPLGISAADRATRYALEVTVGYRLESGGEEVSIGRVSDTAYFDAPNEAFGLIAARRDAETQAAEAVARRLSRRLAAAVNEDQR